MAARDADPDNLLIAYECALRLIAYDEAEWRADGFAALDAVLAGEPSDAFESAIRKRAEAFAAALAAGRKALPRSNMTFFANRISVCSGMFREAGACQ